MNRWTPKTEKLLSKSTSQKSAPTSVSAEADGALEKVWPHQNKKTKTKTRRRKNRGKQRTSGRPSPKPPEQPHKGGANRRKNRAQSAGPAAKTRKGNYSRPRPNAHLKRESGTHNKKTRALNEGKKSTVSCGNLT